MGQESKVGLADLEVIAMGETLRADTLAVDLGAVGRLQILDRVGA